MGLFKAIHRRTWKAAVVTEFHRMHGFNLRAVGDLIGPGTLDDILNLQYEYASGNPTLGAKNVTEILEESFNVNVTAMAMEARSYSSEDNP